MVVQSVRIPACHAGVAGSSPVHSATFKIETGSGRFFIFPPGSGYSPPIRYNFTIFVDPCSVPGGPSCSIRETFCRGSSQSLRRTGAAGPGRRLLRGTGPGPVFESFPALALLSPGSGARRRAPRSLAVHEVLAAPAITDTIDLTAETSDLWVRIRNGFSMPNLNDDVVLMHQQWYQNRPDMLRRMVERSRRYLHHIVEELEKRGMPTELALLPMVESSFNPMAYSRAHASGLCSSSRPPATLQPDPGLVAGPAARHPGLDQRRP